MANELNTETFDIALTSIDECAARELPDSLLIDLDERDELPEATERRMSSGEGLGIWLLFVPDEYGGMGGRAFDVNRICERMAAIDLGLAASELATLLGSDPIRVGGTDELKRTNMGRIAKDGILFAYSATEPEAGSDLGALKTTQSWSARAGTPPATGSAGARQWISNGGVADAYMILAMAPDGPSWFVVGAGIEGFTHGNPEDKHGIRPSKTAALLLNNVYVDAGRLIGGIEGQGLVQAQQVFGYARLMVAAFGLGAAWAALERAITYSKKRIQAGSPPSEKEDYTHKADRPARHRAGGIEGRDRGDRRPAGCGRGSAQRRRGGRKDFATEASHAAADAAIKAHGGYGYTHDYVVEKIKRDVRITTIYEGTSEIMEITTARGRWQEHLKTGGDYYHSWGHELASLHAQHPGSALTCRARTPRTRRLHGTLPRAEADPRPAHPDATGSIDRPGRGRGCGRPTGAAVAITQLGPKASRRIRAEPLADLQKVADAIYAVQTSSKYMNENESRPDQ
jgi:alkylation response protein AidB-like acyl-CoA dehydrogenase